MFMAKRTWALRVMDQANIPASSSLATELVDMLVRGAKQTQALTRTVEAGSRAKLDDLDFIMMSARAMSDNVSAFDRLQEDAGLSGIEALSVLASVRAAANELYRNQGRMPPDDLSARH